MSTILTFGAVLKGLPRKEFDQAVLRHRADKYCKHFTCWKHLIALVYAQLSGASSLRELELRFNSHCQDHDALQAGVICRTTLADANERRSTVVFDEMAAWLIGQVSGKVHREATALTYLLDSTSFTLKGREFDRWTLANRTRNTQGIKLHVVLNLSTKTPQWYSFSAANVNDVDQAASLPLEPGALYVFDKGYCNYNWWRQIDDTGSCFVTRFKSNAAVITQEEREIPAAEQDFVLRDEIVRFKCRRPSGHRINQYDKALRRVTVRRADKPTDLVLATNDLDSLASEIAQRYKERWEIELFFKWIKQHLKIKSFFGRSSNAVRLQLVTALIAYLLIVLYRRARCTAHTLWETLSMISTSLFACAISDAVLPPRRRRPPDFTLTRLGKA